MTRSINSFLRLALLSSLASLGLMISGVAQAQNTTANLKVLVTDPEGVNVVGVNVRIIHVPTDRSITLRSNAAGVVTARGLAVGGPYEVEVADSNRYAADLLQNIYLELDRTEVVALAVRPVIEEIIVTAEVTTTEVRVGVGRDFARSKIDATPSIGRDFTSTLATDPSILVDNSVARGPAVSLAGQNFRFNSVTIDGVAQNDNFGLSKNASATARTPISIDAIQEINVNMAPFDVTYGNFIGGNINIVTKSGTNDFHGSAFYYKTDASFSGDESDGVALAVGDFEEDTYGFTLGGPIIRDKLFFFANYEKFETTLPANTQTIDKIAGVTQADVDTVRTILQTVYGFDPGGFAATDVDEDEKFLLKLDWTINDDHRAVAGYQFAEGDVIFDDFPEIAALNSNRYNINEKMDAFSVHVFSNWTDSFSTEFKVGSKTVENRQISIDPTTPDFRIFTPGGGEIVAGGDRFRHTNELDNESQFFRLKGDYTIGDHILTAGWEQEQYTVRNAFLPGSKGWYWFFSYADLTAKAPTILLYGNSNTGVAQDAETNFELTVDSFYLQDEWSPTDELILKFGVRFDEYSNDVPITDNPGFQARNGFSNGENLDGKDLVLPRFGFNWTPTDRVTVRGGAGLFGGGTPLIMLSNAYAGDGIRRTFLNFFATFFGPPISDSVVAAGLALPDANAAFDNMQQYIQGGDPFAQTDAIDPSFEVMSTWKYSIGGDYLADLSGIGMGDEWLLSADVIFSEVEEGYDIFEGRRTVVGPAPDGRPIYDTSVFPVCDGCGDYIVRNTGIGSSTIVTLNLSKSFYTNFGDFDMTLGYTYQDVDELRSYNRFIHYESFSFDSAIDQNNPVVAPSRYEVTNRVTGTLNWQHELFGENVTAVGLVYAGRSGRHFNYVFGSGNATVLAGGQGPFGGHFLPDWGTEGDNAGSQLFYVPTGPADPIVTGDPAFLADLDTFISSTDCLNAFRGTSVPRNNCDTGWVNVFSLRLVQEISFRDNMSFDLMMDIENVGNLLNSDWGRVDSYTAPSNVAPAIVDIVGGQYVLTPNASYAGTPETIVPRPTIAALASVYRIQFGVRFRF